MRLRIGLIGAGAMGATHARLLSASVASARLQAVCDPVAERAEALAAELGVGVVEANPAQLIESADVDAVVIASPPDTHERLILACLEAGKPVLCEKPLAASATAARRVLEAEAALGRRLVQVGFMRRFDPAYVDLKARLDAGAIGAPLLVHCAHRNRTAPPRFNSEMILRDSLVHDVDIARWLLGQEIVEVTVLTPRPSARAPDGVQDPQLVVLRTDADVLVDVEAFVNAQYGYEIRCEVVGEAGTAALAAPHTTKLRRDGQTTTPVPPGFQERFAAAYAAELQRWTASVASGSAGGPGSWEGYVAAVVCEAAVESLRRGRPAEVRLQKRPASV